ncbi:MAG: hypothetical protein HXY39_04065 [Chloroflexi bacterium]|nr:hypothetical protein [Chloroflexota bacterium]
MVVIDIALEVTTVTPLSVGAGGSIGILADKSIMRDGWDRPIIPGSHLKGRTRHAAEAIAATFGLFMPADNDAEADTPIRRIFGSPQYRSPLSFFALIGASSVGGSAPGESMAMHGSQSGIRPSVAINRRRGTADDKRLLFQETALEGLRFSANPAICGALPDLGHVALLWVALRTVDRWGGAKSRGLGWATTTIAVTANDHPVVPDDLERELRALVARGGKAQ